MQLFLIWLVSMFCNWASLMQLNQDNATYISYATHLGTWHCFICPETLTQTCGSQKWGEINKDLSLSWCFFILQDFESIHKRKWDSRNATISWLNQWNLLQLIYHFRMSQCTHPPIMPNGHCPCMLIVETLHYISKKTENASLFKINPFAADPILNEENKVYFSFVTLVFF